MWTVWDKKSDIDGFTAEFILERNKHLVNEDVIYLKSVNGVVVEIEGKNILASVYGIDATLPDMEFIAEYERVLSEPSEEPSEEVTE
jgi:hypothetical protein